MVKNPRQDRPNERQFTAQPSATHHADGSGIALYDAIGGEEVLRRLVETFYDIIEFEPEGEPLRILHARGHGIAHSRIEQFAFLSGFFGGPKLYVRKYGHSNVRQMHEHVEIGPEARDVWLASMSLAIDRTGISPGVKNAMMVHFKTVADMLVNCD